MAKLDNAIEKRFRNIEIEHQVVAYMMRKSPALSTNLLQKIVSVKPLANILNVVQVERATMTKAAVLQQLKTTHVIKGSEDRKIYATYLDRLLGITGLNDLNERSIGVLVKQLAELSESRDVLCAIKDIAVNLKTFDLDKAKEKLRQLGHTSGHGGVHRSSDYLEGYEQRLETLKERSAKSEEEKVIGLPTGITEFDTLCGGLLPGEFGVIAGRPSVGKTALLLAIAVHAWLAGHNVFVASGEMAREQLEFRVDSSLAGIPFQNFRLGTLSEEEYKKLDKTIENHRLMQDAFFEIATFPRDFTTTYIEAEMDRVQDRWGRPVELACVDYLNIMQPIGDSKGSSKKWPNQSDVVWDIKVMTETYNDGISLWSAGQIIDTAFKKNRLEMDDVKYARAISETAPLVVGLVCTDDDELENTLQFQVLKFRNAPVLKRSIILHPNLKLMRIHEEVIKRKDLVLDVPYLKK